MSSLDGPSRLLDIQTTDLASVLHNSLENEVCLLPARTLHYFLCRQPNYNDNEPYTELLHTNSPWVLYQVLRRSLPDDRAELLSLMKTKDRLRVVGTMSTSDQHEYLDQLADWQGRKSEDWRSGILPVTVMVEESLPAHYPENMEACARCRKEYTVWASVNTIDCGRHSFCDDCELHAEFELIGGCCAVCEFIVDGNDSYWLYG